VEASHNESETMDRPEFLLAAGAVAIAALGHLPVVAAVGHIAVLAESCIVVEPGRVYLSEAQGRPERLGDLPGPASVDGVALAVVGSDPLEQQIPLSWLTLPHDAGPHGAGPLLPLGGEVAGGHELDAS